MYSVIIKIKYNKGGERMKIWKKILIIISVIFVIGLMIGLWQVNQTVNTKSENIIWKELVDNWNKKGLDLVHEGNVEQGIEYFQKALKKAEEYKELGINGTIIKGNLLSNSYNNLGYAYCLLDKYDLSKYYLEKALAIEPNDAIEHSNMGNTYVALEQYEEAMKHYDLSLEYDSKFSYAIYGKASLYYNQNEYERALELFNQYLDQIPDDRDAIDYLIYCNLYLNHLDKALKLADESILSFEDNYDFYIAKGLIYERSKSYDELEQYYKELASIFKDHVNAQIKLGEFYYKNEEYQTALKHFLSSKNRYQENLELDGWLIDCYAALEDFTGLYDFYKDITGIGRVTEQFCIDVAYTYYDSTYYMESIPFFEDAIKINPDSEDAHIGMLQSLYFGKRYQRGIEFGLAAEQKFKSNFDIPFW